MEAVSAFMSSIGVLPVIVQQESTGFIFNRIWRAVKKEALKVVDQGIASVEDVDRTWMIEDCHRQCGVFSWTVCRLLVSQRCVGYHGSVDEKKPAPGTLSPHIQT
jgi:hypothetical protein